LNFVFVSAAIHQLYLDGTDLSNLNPTELGDENCKRKDATSGPMARLTLGIQVTAATNAKWWSDYDVTACA
jgi:hypothetical protein